MRRYFNILPLVFALAILSFSACGVKKNATAEVTSAKTTQPATTEQAETAMDIATPKQAETATDTLPDFLKEFANDSTIHINWAHGIPFIIDDSVPMFLPPIDKNPQEYIIKHIYAPIYPNSLPQEAVYAIIDSIPWINKCINDTKEFVKSHFKETLDRHRFAFHYHLLENDGYKIIEVWVLIDPIWQCCAIPDAYNLSYSYFLNLSGNLLGKMAIRMPYRIGYERNPEYHLRGIIPDYTEYKSFLKTNFSLNKKDLVRLAVYIDVPECWWGY